MKALQKVINKILLILLELLFLTTEYVNIKILFLSIKTSFSFSAITVVNIIVIGLAIFVTTLAILDEDN